MNVLDSLSNRVVEPFAVYTPFMNTNTNATVVVSMMSRTDYEEISSSLRHIDSELFFLVLLCFIFIICQIMTFKRKE